MTKREWKEFFDFVCKDMTAFERKKFEKEYLKHNEEVEQLVEVFAKENENGKDH